MRRPSTFSTGSDELRGLTVAKAIEQLHSGLVVGHAALGRFGQSRGSVAQQVHDGDTATVEADGNLGVRFLGVDAPEVSVPLPGTSRPFVSLTDPRWGQVLADPLGAGAGPAFDPPLEARLLAHLQALAGPDLAGNHGRLAGAAEDALEKLVGDDLAALGKTKEDFRFFLAFAGEVMDRYGRLLAYLHPDQPNTPAAQRLDSYNERLLAAGWVSPYFIWPNINPFRRAGAITAAVPPPGGAGELTERDGSLHAARAAVTQARRDEVGLYQRNDPLRVQAFELRFLARRQPPDRWLVDLSTNDNALLPPQAYPDIPLPEDRLFIPAEYVPLWVEHGWKRG
jgi:endonuclease YncB( thermonuclease family)